MFELLLLVTGPPMGHYWPTYGPD